MNVAFVSMGDTVFYHQNNPNEEGILSHPAMVTKVNTTGSVSLQVFSETHIFAMFKIPLAEKPLPGYFTINAVE